MRNFISIFMLSLCLLACASSPNSTQPISIPKSYQHTNTQSENVELAQQVIIRRTTHGVPHIDATNLAAAGYALGYVQMEDHAQRVIDILLKARGEWIKYHDLSLENRALAIDNDAANQLKYRRAVETWPLLEQDTRDFIDGFTKGLNRYLRLHPAEFTAYPKLKFTVYDVHARNIVAPSNNSIRRFLQAHAAQQQTAEQATSPTQANHAGNQLKTQNLWAKLAAQAIEPNPDVGSNVWAFAPQRTVSGYAILMRNPHLSWDAGYYEAHINVPNKFNFYGDFRVGQAIGIIGGFNQYLGWSTTNNAPDLDEVYSFKADPEQANHYILDGVSVPLTRDLLNIEYKFGDALGTQTREFWSTKHGPVILTEAGKIYVMKSAGNGEFRTGEQFFKMMKAKNLQAWKKAMQMRARISSNLTYADVEGNIFYVWNASMPERPHAGGEDEIAFHVTSSDQMWQSISKWEDLPQLENPTGGYIRNENDTFHFTNLNEIMKPEAFPSFYPKPSLRLRSQHSIELIHNDKKFSLEDVVKLKHSERMLMADRVKDDLIEAVEQANVSNEVHQAIELVKTWDNTVSRDSRGAVLFKTWWNQYASTADTDDVKSSPESVGYSATAEKLFKQPWSYNQPTSTPYGLADYERAVVAFEWAVIETQQRYGDWNVAWGDVHRAVIGEADLPVGGCTGLLGCYRVIWYTQHDTNTQQLQVRGGDGWVFAVEFGEIPRAYSVLAYGQSSKEDSVYNNDQLLNFTNNVMTPVAFSDADISKYAIREYRPGLGN